MTTPIISIIIPIFNSAKYLDKCLTSIINQAIKNIEIICVDDGSTDNSINILENFKKQYEHIYIIRQKNLGPGCARNNGLKVAKGKYLVFIDSDDFIEPNLLEETISELEINNADIVIFRYKEYDDKTHTLMRGYNGIGYRFLPRREPFSYMEAPDLFSITNPATWNKIFSRELIINNNIQFLEIKRAADLYFVYFALTKARRIIHLNQSLINYRINIPNSSSKKYDTNPFDFYVSLLKLKDELIANNQWNTLRKSFINLALLHVIGNLRYHEARNIDTFGILLEELQKNGFNRLNITNSCIIDYYNYSDYGWYKYYLTYPSYKKSAKIICTIKTYINSLNNNIISLPFEARYIGLTNALINLACKFIYSLIKWLISK